jgi:peptidoglycan/xylan/chitin deacetylase (PgdA/CDA1 family)
MSARTAAIRAAAGGLYHGGLLRPLATAASRLRAGNAFTVLVFHRVNDEADPFFPSVPTAVFAERMQHLAENYVVLTVEDLVDRQRHGRVPRNAVAVTFDDGYRDNLTHAAPILTRLGLPATVFLATGYISSPGMPWYDLLALAIKTSRRDHVAVGPGQALPLGSPASRLEALGRVLRHMKGMPDRARRETVERLVADLEPAGSEVRKRLMLTWDEVHALRGLGFSIGAHTVTHPILAQMDPAQARDEIHGSKRAIEEHLGGTVRAFAYPNGGAGDYDRPTRDLVERAGFTCAVTTRRGRNTASTSRFELRRGGPWERHLPTYALKLAWYHLTGI